MAVEILWDAMSRSPKEALISLSKSELTQELLEEFRRASILEENNSEMSWSFEMLSMTGADEQRPCLDLESLRTSFQKSLVLDSESALPMSSHFI